ncbi:MAG: metal-dependent hydrolase [Gemmatimonadaceae bacterium]
MPVENLTHSLMGAALAELALPASATPAQRRMFFTAGVIAANLPDADLVYTRITAPPLGYLLHHRGHTHTLVGLVGLAVLIGIVCLVPQIRGSLVGAQGRFWAMIATSLVSHLVLDSWNSYGVHPFWPFDNRWFYGDSIFIVEPWLWLFLGVAATANAKGPLSRISLGALFAVASLMFAWVGMVPVVALVALVIVAAAITWLVRRWTPRTRSGAALAAVALFVLMTFGMKHVVRERVVASITPGLRGELVDVVLSPQAGNPLCWTALAIEKDEKAGEYALARGSVSLSSMARCGMKAPQQAEWGETLRQSLVTLRALDRNDCRVAAWLQFGRAPVLSADVIADYRFGGVSRGNFSEMDLTPSGTAPSCPEHLTNWSKPRADLLR